MIFIYAWENSGRVKISFWRASARELPFWDKPPWLWKYHQLYEEPLCFSKLLHLKLHIHWYAAGGFEKRTHLSFFLGCGWKLEVIGHLHAKASGALTQASKNSDWSLLKRASRTKNSIQKFNPFIFNRTAADLSSVCECSLRSNNINSNHSSSSKLQQ